MSVCQSVFANRQPFEKTFTHTLSNKVSVLSFFSYGYATFFWLEQCLFYAYEPFFGAPRKSLHSWYGDFVKRVSFHMSGVKKPYVLASA